MSHEPLQRKKHADQADTQGIDSAEVASQGASFGSGSIPPVVQEKSAAGQSSASEQAFDRTHQIAAKGVSGGGGALPFADKIAASFGAEHAGAVSGIKAHVGGSAGDATRAMGAEAYATGNQVAFGSAPSLHTAAHEAAHVVQQKGGVQLKGGVGEAGDMYERNADEVADRVVQGKSAKDLLDPVAGPGKTGSGAVQFLGHKLGEKLPEGAEAPAYGEDYDQRRYSPEQYEKMWEEEQGKKLSSSEKATIERGCIGITANNISGGGNPLDAAGNNTFGSFETAHKYMEGRNKELHEMRANPKTASMAPAGEYIMFAKCFWSNQSDGDNSKADDKAFKPDPKTDRIDMSTYDYKGQPGYVNFDYGYWDDNTQCFWHANHMQYKDPEKRKSNPMKVYQSTKDHFIRGYIDFDRIVFCVALATNYNPGLAAMESANRGGN